MQEPWASPVQMASSLHLGFSPLPSCPSAYSHHWPGRDCHHLRWHQVTRDLHQPIYDLFSSINSNLAWGFPECEIFVPDDNALESSAKPPGCQQLQGDPNPLMLVTPALCLVWLGEETAKGNFCSKNSSLHPSLLFWP